MEAVNGGNPIVDNGNDPIVEPNVPTWQKVGKIALYSVAIAAVVAAVALAVFSVLSGPGIAVVVTLAALAVGVALITSTAGYTVPFRRYSLGGQDYCVPVYSRYDLRRYFPSVYSRPVIFNQHHFRLSRRGYYTLVQANPISPFSRLFSRSVSPNVTYAQRLNHPIHNPLIGSRNPSRAPGVLPRFTVTNRAAPGFASPNRAAPAFPGQTRVAPAFPGQTRVAPALPGQTRAAPALPGQTRAAPANMDPRRCALRR